MVRRLPAGEEAAGEAGIEYAWVDVEKRKGARDEMLRLNGGVRRVPTLLFPDGSVMVEPSSAELGAKLDGRAA